MGTETRKLKDPLSEKYENALYTVACRALAEPYNFHRVAGALSDAALHYGFDSTEAKIIKECRRQFQQDGKYSARTIVSALPGFGGVNDELLHMTQRDTEIDLPFAVDFFADLHGQKVEEEISMRVGWWISQNKTSEEIRIASDELRRERGLTAKQNWSDGKAEFEASLLAALDGKVVEYPVKPPFEKMQKLIPFHEPGEYIIIAGRTGMGKSFVAMNYIYECCLRGVPTCYINLENTPKNVQKRLWQMHSRTAFQHDLSRAGDQEGIRMLKAWEEVKAMPTKTHNTGRSLHTILNTIRQERYERGIELAVIDYIQLMRENTHRGNRVNELGEISAEVRALCLELNIPLIALAQISREGEKSGDNRPSLSHLRGSGDLEQDAATVMLLYRPEYYNILAGPDGTPYPPGYADIHIAKGRDTGNALVEDLRFDPVRGFYEPDKFSPIIQAYDYTIPASASMRGKNEEDIPF